MSLLEAKGILRSYGSALTLDVGEISADSGEVLCILGSSGAGKSTLLRILGLLEEPDAGQVFIEGRKVSHRSTSARRRVATALQRSPLWRGTVIGNVEFGLAVRGVRRRERRARAEQALSEVGLEGLEKRTVTELSGGQAQRVGLARAIAVDPEILLLDEPLAHIDEPLRESLAVDLRKFSLRSGCATVWVTHDRAEAVGVSDRIAVLEAGLVLQCDAAMEVFARPADERVARLTGADNLIPGTVVSNVSGIAEIEASGELVAAPSSLPEGTEVLLLVRPEAVSVWKEPPPGSSPRNRFSGKVREVSFLGPIVKVHIEAGFPIVALLTTPTLEEMGIQNGSRLWAGFKATSAHVIRRS